MSFKSNLRRRATAVAITGAVTSSLVLAAQPAQAGDKIYGAGWDAPPTCFRDDAQVHSSYDEDGALSMGVYQYLTEERYVYAQDDGYRIEYVWVYEVSNPMMGPGIPSMTTVGFAKKVCGGEWIPDYSNIA